MHLFQGEYFRTVLQVSLLGCHSFVMGTLFTGRRVLRLILAFTRLIRPVHEGGVTAMFAQAAPFQRQPEKLSQIPAWHRLVQGLRVAGSISGTARSHGFAHSQLFVNKTQQPSVNSGRRSGI